jgi:hypothetical protein
LRGGRLLLVGVEGLLEGAAAGGVGAVGAGDGLSVAPGILRSGLAVGLF